MAAPATDERRRAYSYRTAAHAFSVSESALRKAVREQRIRARRIGPRSVRLDPEDLEREYGFAGQTTEMDPETQAFAESLRQALEEE